MTGEIGYIEMGSGDAPTTAGFFAGLFGWTFHAAGPGGEGGVEAGGLRAGLHGGDPGWGIVAYFRVTDIEAAARRVVELGGSVEAEAVAEPGFGRFRHCRDPQGLRFGLHEPEP